MGEEKLPEGYVIPLHRSLTESIMICGVSRNFFYFNLMMGLGISTAIRFYPFLVITFLFHICMVFICKKDPQYYDAMQQHINDKKYFDA